MIKTLVISDVHGLYYELLSALSAAGYKQGDRLICLGDYTDIYARDREMSIRVLDYLVDQAYLYPHHVFIRGNHEDMLLSALLMDPDELIPGTPEMYRQDFLNQITDRHKPFLGHAVKRYAEGEFIFVHDADGMQQVPGKIIVAGHWHAPEPIVKAGCITMASSRRVFVLDIETMRIYDSEGRSYDASAARK